MKSIDINKKQKEMLLEMCKVLFPEYTTIPNDKNPKFLTINWFTKQGYFIHLMDDYDLKENKMIHWFEFCMTHLCDKIWEKYPKYPKNHIYNGLAMTCNRGVKVKTDLILRALKFHPVDYLYEEFKKLK